MGTTLGDSNNAFGGSPATATDINANRLFQGLPPLPDSSQGGGFLLVP